MARKDRSLAGFGDLASDNNTNKINDNDNVNINNDHKGEPDTVNPDYLDKLIDVGHKKKEDLVLIGVYLQKDIAKILDQLGKKGGRGAKSRIANDALKKLFEEKGLL